MQGECNVLGSPGGAMRRDGMGIEYAREKGGMRENGGKAEVSFLAGGGG